MGMLKLSTSWCALALLLILSLRVEARPNQPQPAGGDSCMEEQACSELFEQGKAQYKAGNYAAALRSFQAANNLRSVPLLGYNIARAHHQLGNLDEAQLGYRQFIAQTPDEVLRKKAQDYLAQLQAEQVARQAASVAPSATATQPTTLQSAAPQPPADASPTDPSAPAPLYKKWWLWTAIGGAVLVGTVSVVVASQVDPRFTPATVVDLRSRF